LNSKIINAEQGLKVLGEWTFTFDDGTIIKQKNLVVESGLGFLATLFIGEHTSDFSMYLALGTGTTQATSGDTGLQAEAIRKTVTSKQNQANVVRLRAFFLATEANGDWKEFGIFVAGTDVLNSGILFNRLVTPISKASNQVMSVECRLTFLN